MAGRDLSLTSRVEAVRETRRIPAPVHFSSEEIYNHFYESLTHIKEQFMVADSLAENGNTNGCETVWRSQVVLAEGLLDFYLHDISKYCMYQMFCNNWNKTEKYALFMVPMAKVEIALTTASSNEWFFEYLNNRFSRDVFLSVESMRDQLNLIGVGFVDAMAKAFPRADVNTSNKDGAKIVGELFKRRNEIAHQNDRDHATAIQNNISKEFVEDYIQKIENIVNGIHTIIKEKDSELEELL